MLLLWYKLLEYWEVLGNDKMSKHASTQLGMSFVHNRAHNIQPEEQTQVSEIIHYASTLLPHLQRKPLKKFNSFHRPKSLRQAMDVTMDIEVEHQITQPESQLPVMETCYEEPTLESYGSGYKLQYNKGNNQGYGNKSTYQGQQQPAPSQAPVQQPRIDFGMILPMKFGLEQFLEMTKALKCIEDKYMKPHHNQYNRRKSSKQGNNTNKQNQQPDGLKQLTSQMSQHSQTTDASKYGWAGVLTQHYKEIDELT